MKVRKFNPLMGLANQYWASQVLNMQLNPQKGIDLIDENKGVELKFTLIVPKERYPIAWTVLEHQMNYNKEKPCYWALGTYRLNKRVKEIRSSDLENLESLVIERNLYLVPWKWMNQFPAHETAGETVLTKWEYTFRYPKYNKLPKITKTYEVEKGKVHLTPGISEKIFQIADLAVPI